MPKAKDSPKKAPIMGRCALRPGVAAEEQCDKAADAFAIRGVPSFRASLSSTLKEPSALSSGTRQLASTCVRWSHLRTPALACGRRSIRSVFASLVYRTVSSEEC